MRKLGLALLFAILGLAPAQAQNITNPAPVAGAGAYNSAPPTCTAGQFCLIQTDANGNLKTVSSGTPAGTQDVNLIEVLGAAPSATNPIWVSPATASTPWAISAASGTIASGAVASGAFASGALASGSVASGAIASGAIAAGAVASGAFASGSQAIGITPTDRTIASASGASEQIAAANASRKGLIIQNTGNANCGVNPTGGTAAIGGAGTLTLLPSGSYQPRIPTLSAITVICTAGQPIYGEEN